MTKEFVILLFTTGFGIIGGLIGVIYRIQSKAICDLCDRQDQIMSTNNKLYRDIGSIQTDILWIKNKLEKI